MTNHNSYWTGVCKWQIRRCSTTSDQKVSQQSCMGSLVSQQVDAFAPFNGLLIPFWTPSLYCYFQSAVLTLCANTPSLPQLLQLWDYLLSFGTHLSILCILAQLLLIRDELMASPHPMKLLRQFPDLNAKSIIGVATTLVRDLDDTLYSDLVRHIVEL
jgi:hypothetical protein